MAENKTNLFDNVWVAPTYELAEQFADENHPEVTVEAEYGDKVVDGSKLTLAHHGPRANNPAPCNDDRAVKMQLNTPILLSHVDLDAAGGVMGVLGTKPEDKNFWLAAEYIDVNGPHHVHDLKPEIQDQLNAVWAYIADNRGDRPPRDQVYSAETELQKYQNITGVVLDARNPEHDAAIKCGQEWEKQQTDLVESKLVNETKNIRLFDTDGPFCSASYYSPKQDAVIPATVSFNEKFHSVTLAFAEGEQSHLSAREIVQEMWGDKAGGRTGIAGSPRGQEMTLEDAQKLCELVEEKMQNLALEQDALEENDRNNSPVVAPHGDVEDDKFSKTEKTSHEDLDPTDF